MLLIFYISFRNIHFNCNEFTDWLKSAPRHFLIFKWHFWSKNILIESEIFIIWITKTVLNNKIEGGEVVTAFYTTKLLINQLINS